MEQQEPTKKKRSFFKSLKGIVVILVVLAILCGVGYPIYRYFTSYVGTNDAIIDGYSAMISSDITARIITLYVDEGDVVESGQIIAQLDESILLTRKYAAAAKVESLKAQVEYEEVHFEKVRNDYCRAKKAFEDTILSCQDMDHAQKDYELARTSLQIARADLELSEKELGVIVEELRHTQVWAPRKGAIAKRWVLAGDVVQVGQAMFSLYDLESIWVTALLEETKVQHIGIGDIVKISVDAYPGYRFKGKIFAIRGAAASQFSLVPQDNATGNYTKVAQRVPLKISIHEVSNDPSAPPCYLFPGMSAEVKIKVR